MIFSFTSCSADSENDFSGGELLDDAKMSEIKSEFFAAEESITTEMSETIKVSETADKVETAENTGITEINTEAKAEESEYTETTSEDVTNNDHIVFWTEGGRVWHLKEDCRYLKQSTVVSGTVEEAIKQGKDRVCSSCSK